MELNVFVAHNYTHNITAAVTYDFSNITDSNRTKTIMGPPLYIYGYVSVINTIVFFLGVLGNILVIQVVARVRSMRKRVNYFLASLSVSDLLVLTVSLPTALHEFYGKEKWLLGEAMCKIVPFLENASHHCCVLTLLAIGFERYYAICHPLRNPVGSRMSSPTVIIPTIWVVSYGVSIPFIIMSKIHVEVYYDDSLVDICRTSMTTEHARAYIIFITVGFLAFPLLLLTVVYSAIIRTLRASTAATRKIRGSNSSTCVLSGLNQDSVRSGRAVASRHQVVRMMVGVMALYFVCLLPLRCVQFWLMYSNDQDLINLGFEGYLNLINCVRILVYINSAGNPIIYSLLSSNFREAFKLSFSRSRQHSYNTATYCNNQLDKRCQKTSVLEVSQMRNQPSVMCVKYRKTSGAVTAEDCSHKLSSSQLPKISHVCRSGSSGSTVVNGLSNQIVSGCQETEILILGHNQIQSEPAFL